MADLPLPLLGPAERAAAADIHSRALPNPELPDFEALLRRGIARAQAVSGDVWTDYNEHDPGVTILEQLCFALTDLGYRTDHPVADLLASVPLLPAWNPETGANGAGNGPEAGFHSTAKLLSSSAVTEDDLKRVVLAHFPEVWNIWLDRCQAVGDVQPSTFEVLIQKSEDPADQKYGLRDDQLREGVWHVLRSEACLGMSFREPALIRTQPVAVMAEIQLDPRGEGDPAAVLSRLLFAIDHAINPMPRMTSYASMQDDKRPPEEIFDGPLTSHGFIDLGEVPARPRPPSEDKIREALLDTPGVASVGAVQVPHAGEWPKNTAFQLSLDAGDLTHLSVLRGGSRLPLEAQNVAVLKRRLNHRRRQHRFSGAAMHGVRRAVQDIFAAPGTERPALHKYRSIQHLFPAIYGLGKFGDVSALDSGLAVGGRLRSFGASAAQLNQLRAFLLIFEQFVANYLVQLANAPRLLSWHEEWRQSYFVQAVPALEDGPAGTIVQEPPGSVDVLAASQGGEAAENLQTYTARLADISATMDQVDDRTERAYDHLLARYNESFDNTQLDNLSQQRRGGSKDSQAGRNKRKRRFLERYEILGSRRGASSAAVAEITGETGSPRPNVSIQPPTLVERIELLGGLPEGTLLVVDHAKLGNDPDGDGVGEMMIWPPAADRSQYQPAFQVGPAFWSFPREKLPGQRRVNLLVKPALRERFPEALAWGELLVEVDTSRRGGRFGVQVVEELLGGGRQLLARSLNITASHGEARQLAMDTAEALGAVVSNDADWDRPRGFNTFPARFYDHRLTAFLPVEDGATEGVRQFFDTLFRREAPAHLTLDVFWVPADDLQIVKNGLSEIYQGGNGPAMTRLRRMIETKFVERMFEQDYDEAGAAA